MHRITNSGSLGEQEYYQLNIINSICKLVECRGNFYCDFIKFDKSFHVLLLSYLCTP
nr:MAG TPA: hypothetical protein [Herelleviridae sp.]